LLDAGVEGVAVVVGAGFPTSWAVSVVLGLALRWRDLDVDGANISVRRSVGLIRTKGVGGAETVEGSTKSGKKRVVDLDPQTVAALRGWRLARAGLDLRWPATMR
jgi:hypothetical protein